MYNYYLVKNINIYLPKYTISILIVKFVIMVEN